jgi:hypothetical protein
VGRPDRSVGPTFVVRADLEKRRRSTFVLVRFYQDDPPVVHVNLTARSMRPDRTLGDL